MLDKQLFGERLRSVRQGKKEPQSALAALLGISVTQISDMENGKTGTSMERLKIICEHYKISADYLLGLEDEGRPDDSF